MTDGLYLCWTGCRRLVWKACVHVSTLVDVRAAASKGQALMVAGEKGQADLVHALLEAGADVNTKRTDGRTALMLASEEGHDDCVRALLVGGADTNCATEDGWTALTLACNRGHAECVRALLEAGADVHGVNIYGISALRRGRKYLAILQLLCAYGARRADLNGWIETLPDECREWLLMTSRWTSQLHYMELFSAPRVHALIVDGADVHASDNLSIDAPTPLTVARALLARDPLHKGARLVVEAGAPWSRQNCHLFPKAARARAMKLLLLGSLLSHDERFAGGGTALNDVWREHVMAHAVTR